METAFRYQRVGLAPRFGQFEVADVLALGTEVGYLREYVATLHDMLERAQWGNTGACPECGRVYSKGHEPDCRLAAALRGGTDGE
jgi:hypothetical protein